VVIICIQRKAGTYNRRDCLIKVVERRSPSGRLTHNSSIRLLNSKGSKKGTEIDAKGPSNLQKGDKDKT